MNTTFDHERVYLAKANRLLAAIVALHVLVLPLLAAFHGNAALTFLAAGAAVAAAPVLLAWRNEPGAWTGIVNAVAMMGMSALVIAAANGRTEFHFHVFVALALLTALPSVKPLLAAAGAIAVQHVGAWLVAPRTLLNYDAGFGDVLLHAAFVILETIPCCWIAHQLGLAIRARAIVHRDLERNTEELLRGTAQVHRTNEQLARGAAAQQSSLSEVSRWSTGIEQEVERLCSAALDAERSASQLAVVAERTEATLESLVAGVNAVAQSSQRVGGIAKSIDSIAFQTNLLALNAAVEAARAGEVGAGFAVVADEVRTLAQNAARAAHDADEILRGSIEQTRTSATEVLEVQSSVKQMTGAAASFRELIERLRASAASQQEHTRAMSAGFKDLSAVTCQAAGLVEESKVANARLHEASTALGATVTELKSLA